MAHAFFLGVDARPGAPSEHPGVAYALLEKSAAPDDAAPRVRLHRVRHLPEGAAPTDLADHLQGLVAEQPYTGRISLIVNRRTPFGQALVEALRDRGLDPVAATLATGSGRAAGGPDELGVHLEAVDLARTLVNLHWDGRLVLSGHTHETASRLARDVQALAGHAGTDADPPALDPAALHLTSAALATWLGVERSFDPSKHLKNPPNTEPTAPDGT